MTPLRQRMVNDMTVRGLSENTKTSSPFRAWRHHCDSWFELI